MQSALALKNANTPRLSENSLTHPTFIHGLAAEGTRKDSWIGVSGAALTHEGCPGIALVKTILDNGGRVVVLDYTFAKNGIPKEQYTALLEKYGPQKVSSLHCGMLATNSLWACDYVGHFGRTKDGALIHLAIQYLHADEDGAFHVRAPVKFDKLSDSQSTLWPTVFAKGGDVLPLSEEVIAVSRRTAKQNFEAFSASNRAKTVSAIGMKRMVVLPSTDNDVEHVDTMVGVINGVAFVPRLITPSEAPGLDERTELAVRKLRNAGFSVARLPMTTPEVEFSSNHTISPVNFRLFYSTEGELKVVVPIDPKTPPRALAEMRDCLIKKGKVKGVHFLHANPAHGGLAHCASTEIPAELIENL